MKRLLLLILLLVTASQGFSQTKGISYQAVILNPQEQELPGVNAKDNLLVNSTVSIQFTIVNASGSEEYQEYHSTTTDKYGMLNLLIGTGTLTSSNDFNDIVWNGTTKKLKVGIDFSGGNNFSPLSEQNLTYMPQPANDETIQLISDNANSILAEKARAENAEQSNTAAVETEKTRAENAEQTNAAAVATEKTRAENAEQTNALAVETERERAENAEQTNALAVETERERAENAEQTNALAVETETARAENAEQTNALAVETERERAENAEQTNAAAIEAERERAIVAEQTNIEAISLNTAKVGITPAQIATISNTTGINSGDQDISGIATNATAITALQTEQTTQNTAIALNTAKTGITAQQASDITANNAKVGLNPGTNVGEMLYWNGAAWVVIAATTVKEGAELQMISGVPTWVGGQAPVTSKTGRIWMDRNLGASQVATSSTDAASYGDLYQWGRGTDGHQLRTSAITTTLSNTDVPGHGDFILHPASSPWDWRSPQNANLWQGVNGTNNPCPIGYRIPTETEWDAERLSWSTNNAAGAFVSPLKLPVAGSRYQPESGSGPPIPGSIINVGSRGFYWSSTVLPIGAREIILSSVDARFSGGFRAAAYSVRCIKD